MICPPTPAQSLHHIPHISLPPPKTEQKEGRLVILEECHGTPYTSCRSGRTDSDAPSVPAIIGPENWIMIGIVGMWLDWVFIFAFRRA